MKNPTPAELSALKARAAQIAESLPPVRYGEDGRLDAQSRDAFDKLARRVLRRYGAIGASLVLCHPTGESDVFTYGYARLKPCMPVTEKTCFRVASVSKLVMAFGALALCERGVLDLDRDISDYLGYPVRNPRHPDAIVTSRMLLTHTAAIRDEGNYSTRGMQGDCTLRELLGDAQNWLDAVPGASFHYTNLGAGVMGCVMEAASGETFESVMQRCVFKPLSIRASYAPSLIVPHDDLADGYGVRVPLLPPKRKYDAAALCQNPAPVYSPERDYLIAAGRMITDSHGLSRLVRLLGDGGGIGVLSGESLSMMRSPQDGLGGVGTCARGLNTAFLPGVFDGFDPVGHQGVAYGMCAELFADPARHAGVGLMTSGVMLVRQNPPLMNAGFELLSLAFGCMAHAN